MASLPDSVRQRQLPSAVSRPAAPRFAFADYAIWAYLFLAVGRVNELVPGLSSLPLAKIAIGLALLGTFQIKGGLSTVTLRGSPMARTALWVLALCVFSLFVAVVKSDSLMQLQQVALVVAVSCFLIVKLCRSWAHVERTALVLAISGLPLAVMALTSSEDRVYAGSSYDTNDLAYVLVTLLPITLACAVTRRGLPRLLLLGVATLFALTTLMTASRGGALGLGAVLVLLLFVPLKKPLSKDGKRVRNRWLLRAILLAVLVAGAWTQLPDSTRERIATLVNLEGDYNLDAENTTGRTDIWKRNAAAAMRRPWGYGIGSFMTVDAMTGGRWKAPHNSLLQAWVEIGLLGLICLLRMYWLSWKGLIAVGRNGAVGVETLPPERTRPLAVALSVGLVGNFVCAFFLSQAFSNLLWSIFAVIIAALALCQAPAVANRPRK